MKIRHFVFAATLAATPFAGAMAQSNGPAVGATETKPADPKPAATTNAAGATGSTVAAGSGSTVSGDKAATAEKKTGSTASDGGGGAK
jgi:hypothetical protein